MPSNSAGLRNFASSPAGLALLGLGALCILPTLAMWAMGSGLGVWRIRQWTEFLASNDSWVPIKAALEYLARGDAAGLYEETYYRARDQFLYPPVSLALFRITEELLFIDWSSPRTMNILSWFLIPLSAAIVATIVFKSIQLANRQFPERAIRRPDAWLITATAAASVFVFYPLIKGYTLGQIQTLLTTLILLSIACWTVRHKLAAGICLGLVCAIKPHLVLIYLWAVLRREFGFVAGGLLVLVPLSIFALIAFGLPVHLEYLDLMSFLSRRGESYYASYSINGLLNRMFFLGPNLEWDGTHSQIIYNKWVHMATVVSSLALVALALFWRVPRRISPLPLDYCTALVVLSIAAPVAYEHHFGFTIAVFWICLVAMHMVGMTGWRHLALLAAAYFLCANFIYHPLDRLADTYFNFLQSYMMYGIFALIWLLFAIRARVERTALPVAAAGGPRLRQASTGELPGGG